MVKRRTILTSEIVSRAEARPKGQKTSAFLITLIPNAATVAGNHDHELLKRKLQAFGDVVLSKKVLLKFLDFKDKEGEIKLTREQHLARIDFIDPLRTAAVEYNSVGRLHIHIYVEFKHRTYMSFSIDRLKDAAQKIIGIDKHKMKLQISVQGTSNLRAYVRKYHRPEAISDIEGRAEGELAD